MGGCGPVAAVGLGADPARAPAPTSNEGGHRVGDRGGVADQYHHAAAPACGGDLVDRGDVDPVRIVELPQQLWDRGGEAGEPLAQPPYRVAIPLTAVGGVGGHVGIGIDQPLADRDSQEGGAPAEHDRPGGDLGRAGGQEPPAVLADRDWRPWVDGQPPDRGAPIPLTEGCATCYRDRLQRQFSRWGNAWVGLCPWGSIGDSRALIRLLPVALEVGPIGSGNRDRQRRAVPPPTQSRA